MNVAFVIIAELANLNLFGASLVLLRRFSLSRLFSLYESLSLATCGDGQPTRKFDLS